MQEMGYSQKGTDKIVLTDWIVLLMKFLQEKVD